MTKLYKSTFYIAEMDCPSEETLIRMKLEGEAAIVKLDFDIPQRKLVVFHTGSSGSIYSKLESLNLGTQLQDTTESTGVDVQEKSVNQKNVLWTVLAINFAFFVIEMGSGIFSGSMGLVADSLDMLADALVYGLSLMAVGAVATRKKKVAQVSGYLQILLAIIGLSEVIRRFVGMEIMPEFGTMILISALALIANATCLWLLQRTRSNEAHIRASIIFSANDVIINIGVIIAALLVWLLDSNIPDLTIGIVVFLIVIRGALRILQLAK